MKVAYDFHIHTALSPCAVDSMTPNNIINMALLNELDAIAITDHNSCQNAEVIMKLAVGTDLIVIPGIEIESREEIHIIALFPEISGAQKVQEKIYESLVMRVNQKSLFGEQLLFDEEDEVIGRVDQLLAMATALSMKEIKALVENEGGIFIPAHIDRPSYSIIANLGLIPKNINLSALEISRFANFEQTQEKYPTFNILQSSDAHELGFIGICKKKLEVEEKSIQAIFDAIRNI